MLETLYTWTPQYRPITIGTVFVVVNEDTNRTVTTTKIRDAWTEYSTISILSRNDTNAAGTVTAAVTDNYGHVVTNL